MKRFSLLSFVVCAVLFAGEWTFSPQIPAQQSRLVRMRLKADEIARLGERTDWLRLRDKFGMEVPYAISMEMETTSVATERAFPCDVTQIRTLDDGSVEILCELKDAKAPEKLTMRFSTKMHDFEEQVQIFGETTNGWKTLCDEGFIFDSSRLPNLRNLDVAFQRAECLRFRILLSQGSFEYKNALRHIVASESSTAGTERSEATDMEVRDFKMDGFEVRGVVETQRSGAPCLVPIPARSLVHGSSRYEYIVTPSFYPVYGLKLDSDSDYFSRKLRIFREDSNGGGASFVQDAVINRLRLSGFSQEETSVRFSPVNNGNLRLEFDSDVAIPLELSSARCLSPCYTLYFIGTAENMPYHLTAEEDGAAPHYDTDGILQYAQGKMISLDATMEQCGQFAGKPYERTVISNAMPRSGINLRWCLIAVVVIAVLTMTYALAKVIKSTTSPRQ